MLRKLTKKQIATAIQSFAPAEALMPEWVDKAAQRKTGGKRDNPEEQLHLTCVAYLETKRHLLWWHTSNSTFVRNPDGKTLGYLAKLKRMGVKKGVPDITVVGAGSKPGEVKLLFFELKSPTGKLSTEQEQFMDEAFVLGATCIVVRDVVEMIDALRAAGL